MLAAIIDDVDLVVLDFSMESIEVAIGVDRDARRNLNTRPAASIKRRMEKPLEKTEREEKREREARKESQTNYHHCSSKAGGSEKETGRQLR